MMKKLFFYFVVALVFLSSFGFFIVSSTHAGTGTATINQPCGNDDDCEGSLLCIQGDMGPGICGECRSDFQCQKNYPDRPVCNSSGFCVATSGGSLPIDQGGKLADGKPCSAPSECAGGVCYQRLCETRENRPNGASCDHGYQCNSRGCNMNICAGGFNDGSICENNDMCLSGFCDPATNKCATQSSSGSNNQGSLPTSGGGSKNTNNANRSDSNAGVTGGTTVKASDVGYSFDKIRGIFVNGVCQLTRLAIVVAVLFLLYVGYQFMSAGGAEKNITNAKENLKYVFIGIVIIVGVDVIIATIGNAVAGSYSLLDCSGSGSVVNVNGTDSGGQ